MNPSGDPSRTNDPGDESLDRLLAQARWPEPSAGSTRRLRQQWLTQGERRRMRIGLAAAAAVLLVVVGIAMWQRQQSGSLKPVVRMVIHPDEPTSVHPPRWREPNAFERLLAQPRNTARTTHAAQPKPEQLTRRQVEQLLDRIADPATRDDALQTVRDSPNPPIGILMQQLDNGRVARRFAAATALGSICRPQLVQQLCRMVEQDVHRREALAALMYCQEPQAARFLMAVREDPVIDAEYRSVQVQMKRVF